MNKQKNPMTKNFSNINIPQPSPQQLRIGGRTETISRRNRNRLPLLNYNEKILFFAGILFLVLCIIGVLLGVLLDKNDTNNLRNNNDYINDTLVNNTIQNNWVEIQQPIYTALASSISSPSASPSSSMSGSPSPSSIPSPSITSISSSIINPIELSINSTPISTKTPIPTTSMSPSQLSNRLKIEFITVQSTPILTYIPSDNDSDNEIWFNYSLIIITVCGCVSLACMISIIHECCCKPNPFEQNNRIQNNRIHTIETVRAAEPVAIHSTPIRLV